MTEHHPTGGLIRRLWPSDVEALQAHLLRLDPETRRSRFCGAVSEAYLERYAQAALQGEGLVLGFVRGGEIRGAAELHGDGGWAEAAFSVETAERRRGVGSSLFRRVVLAARNRGVRTIQLRCLPHNRAMQALARRHGARLVFDGDEMLGRMETGRATPFTLWHEALAEGLAWPAALPFRPARDAGRGQAASGSSPLT